MARGFGPHVRLLSLHSRVAEPRNQLDGRVGRGHGAQLRERLHIKDVDLPICAITCETDHIAAWKDCYRGMSKTGSRNRTFILSESGHIAGIVNPPSKKKYGHYINDDLTGTAEEWLDGAKYHEGSWWPVWESWIAKRSGKWVAPREPGDSAHPPLCPAPGTYVKVKARQAEH